MKLKLLCTIALVAILSLSLTTSRALADSLALNFEGYTIGNINGQDGWTKTGAFDVAVVANTYGFATFGAQSLRLSDAVTSGSFGDQTFAKPLVNAVGETAATAAAFSVGTRQGHFETQFDLASALPTLQTGMHVSVSPDRGDGSRMSYLRFEDQADGIHVFFDDAQGTTNPANFVETDIATLSRTPHTIKLTMDMLAGPSNDIVKVYVDGVLKITGTSWENYYRYDSEAATEQSPRIIKTVLFRVSGTANPSNAGKGFLFDNLSTSSSPLPSPAVFCGSDTSTFYINFAGVTNLYGYQFKLHYNNALASAVGSFDNSFFDTSTNAVVPGTWNATISSGVISFAASKSAPGAAVSGSGTVASVTFTGLTAGSLPLTFSDVLLSDKDGNPIEQTLTGTTLTVCGLASASGTVSLQGRATPMSAGTVTLSAAGFGPFTTNFDATTGAWSMSNIPVMPAGTSYTFAAAHGLYLGNQLVHTLNPADVYAAATTKLLGGDATNDGAISILDVSCIGGAFGAAPAVCGATGSSDINADLITNIFDLVLAGGNYGLNTPQPW